MEVEGSALSDNVDVMVHIESFNKRPLARCLDYVGGEAVVL